MSMKLINIRMDEDLKKEMEIVCNDLGINITTAFTIFAKKLISELERKLKRILYFEDSRPNYFRQHITDIKYKLSSE